MRTLVAMAVGLLAASPVAANSDGEHCEVAEARTLGELQTMLSRRAVDAVNLAATSQGADNPSLMRLISPTASFSLGAGDVRRPLGAGAAGAQVLAREMNADTFRFLGWDYIPTPVDDPCASHEVEVEFTDAERRRVFLVTFTFESGRVVAVAGWTRSYEAGSMEPAEP